MPRYGVPFAFLVTMYMLPLVLNFAFAIGRLPVAVGAIYVLWSGLVFTLFLFLTRSDPGIIPSNGPWRQVVSKSKERRVCFQCRVVSPARSRHCQICRRCVSVFDHHCPWVGNCIGSNNLLLFLIFVGTLASYALYSMGMSIALLSAHNKSIKEVGLLLAGSVSLVVSLLGFPLCSLVYFQCSNACHNQTTFQRLRENGTLRTRLDSSCLNFRRMTLHNKSNPEYLGLNY